jgi:uncharacterized protein YfiM (DUF2279 family)
VSLTFRESLIVALAGAAYTKMWTGELTAEHIIRDADGILAAAAPEQSTPPRKHSLHQESLDVLLGAVSETWGVEKASLIARDMRWDVADARHAFCFLANKFVGARADAISAVLDGRDLAVVRHSVKRVEELMETDPEFLSKLQRVILELGLKRKATRQRNPLFDAIAELDGGADSLTAAAATRIGYAMQQIKAASPDVTAEEIRKRHQHLRLHFPHATPTSTSLATHWARCAFPPSNGSTRHRDNVGSKRHQPAEADADTQPDTLLG